MRNQRTHKFGRFVLCVEPGIAVENRQRQKRAVVMTDRTEIRVGDDVERLFAAIVGMRPPADIRQEARRVTKTPLVLVFAQACDAHQPIGPPDQFFRVTRRA